MKAKTFAIPLKKPSSGRFYNVSNDYEAIGQEYHKRFGGNPFAAAKPFVQPPPNTKCSMDGCMAEFSHVTKTWSTGCTGRCQEC